MYVCKKKHTVGREPRRMSSFRVKIQYNTHQYSCVDTEIEHGSAGYEVVVIVSSHHFLNSALLLAKVSSHHFLHTTVTYVVVVVGPYILI